MVKSISRLLLALLFFVSCHRSTHLEDKGIVFADYTPVAPASEESIFQLVSSEHSGIVFNNFIQESPKYNINVYDYFYNGGGVAIGDINNDHLPDIFFTGNMEPNRLYLNKGNFKFEDVTEVSGLFEEKFWSTGVTMHDINQDGWLDIYVCNSGPVGLVSERRNLLYINNQDGTFEEAAFNYGLDDMSYSSQAAMLDYDLDGDLDMYVMNHTDFINRFKNEKRFPNKLQKIQQFSNRKEAQRVFNNILFERKSNGTFERNEEHILSKHWGFGLGVVVSDVNKDSYPDLYIANDYFKPDFFYINDGHGSFVQDNKKRLGHNSQFSMGADIADIDNDLWPDIGVVDMVSAERVRNKVLMSPMNEQAFRFVTERIGFQEQYMFNVLQLNNGNGHFSDIGHLMGTTQTDWSWSSLFADFDMDGDKDYLITNGFRRDTKNRDIQAGIIAEKKKMNLAQDSVNILDFLSRYPSVPLTNYLFENKGNFMFDNESENWGFVDPSFSNGAAYGDLDNDGDLDLVINNIDREAFVYRNTTREKKERNFIKVAFDSNPKNYNAKVTLTTGETSQFLEYNPTRGYLSSMEPVLFFGLGSHDIIDKIKIEFLYGRILEYEDVPPNQTLKIAFDDSVLPKDDSRNELVKLFESGEHIPGLDYTHIENNYWDFTTEVLLPHMESRNGPHVTVGDVNNDSRQDVFIGGAKEASGALFIQKRDGTFSNSNVELFEADKSFEDIGSLFFDYDNDGNEDLYVVSGGGGDVLEIAMWRDRLYRNNGNGRFVNRSDLLPEFMSSGGNIKEFDFDSDGDLDLFIGGRVTPGNYPVPPQSILLENQGSKFEDVTVVKAPGLRNVGMVTDFQWVDFSEDGQVDLVVVGEWMRIELFEQKDGVFEQVTDQYFSEDTRGWWFSSAVADFDGDGDMDLVAGNLGLNNKFHASSKKPLEIFFNDFDGNGTNDIVLAKTDENGNNYVMRGKDCSTAQMPFISEKFKKYEDFAKASLTDVFDEVQIESALHYSVKDFSSAYFENVGGKFLRKKLPMRAQFAPIRDILVEDFDKDGHLDMVVAGNLFDTEIETTAYDAGTGVFLKGDGQNNFKAFAVHESGLYFGKNLRDLAIIRIGSDRYILGANNNDVLDIVRINRPPRL